MEYDPGPGGTGAKSFVGAAGKSFIIIIIIIIVIIGIFTARCYAERSYEIECRLTVRL